VIKLREVLAKKLPEPTLKILFKLLITLNGTRWKRFVIFKQWLFTSRNPKTYSQKLKYKMTFDRRDILTQFADKLAARDIVQELVGAKYLSNIFQISSRPEDIEWAKLPREFVCKTNHMSGGNILVWNGAPSDARLPRLLPTLREKTIQVTPDNIEIEAVNSIVDTWLNHNYSWVPGRSTYEWGYENIDPKVYVEEFLHDEDGNQGSILRFHVFNGRVEIIRYPKNSVTMAAGSTLSRDWKQMDVTFKGHPIGKNKPDKPKNVDEMIEIAETLGSLVDYIRVDLYDLGNKIIFSELTNYPISGSSNWTPKRFEKEIGKFWEIKGYSHKK
jgi:hypothetical protein